MGSQAYVATSGALARLRQLDALANNLANARTPGFKAQESVFEAVLQSTFRDTEGGLVPGAPARAFVAALPERSDFGPGSSTPTGAPLDVAIEGPGFFEVETPEGPRYTRAGHFSVNSDGQLSTSDGFAVSGEGGPLNVEPGATLSPEGALLDAEGNVIGRLKVVEFDGPEALQQLQREGRNLYAVPDGVAPRTREDVALLPGFLEDSNVDSVAALAEMVILQRAFQTNLEALRADDLATESLIRRFSE